MFQDWVLGTQGDFIMDLFFSHKFSPLLLRLQCYHPHPMRPVWMRGMAFEVSFINRRDHQDIWILSPESSWK